MVDEPLCTVDEVAARSGEPIVTNEDIALAEAMIFAASVQVRHYGKPWPTVAEAPSVVRAVVIAAATRAYLNPAGFTDERADSVSFKRADMYAADVELSPREIQMIRQAAGAASVSSIPMTLGEDRWKPTSVGRLPYGIVRRDLSFAVPVNDGNEMPVMFGEPTPGEV